MADQTVPLPQLTPDELARFHSLSEPDTRTGCWNWQGGKWAQGYGYFLLSGWGMARAHRIAYALEYGDTAEHLDHLCHDPTTCPGGSSCPHRACVNPKHLQPASKRTNVLRGSGPTARNFRKTHCVNGHEFTPENTWVDPGGWRQCRTCRRDAARRSQQRHRDANNAKRRAQRARVAHEPRPCEECGSSFVPVRSTKRFCSTLCGQRHGYRRRHA